MLHRLRTNSPSKAPRRSSKQGRRQAYIVQANPAAPGLAGGLIKSYCLHALGLGSDWNVDLINFEGPRYKCLKDTLSGHYAIDGVFMLRELYRRLESSPPDVIAFSSYLWNLGIFSALARSFRELFPHTTFVIGGMGIFGHEREFLEDHPEFDIALGGEGEPAFGALLTALLDDSPDLGAVPGLTARVESELVSGPANQQMTDLDVIPSPITRGYVEILGDALYGPHIMLETSRGCPMPCAFCLMSELPAKGRYHSFEYVREELDWVLERGINVEFADAIFHVNVDRCNQILEYLLRNHNGKSKFSFEIFVELMKDSTIELMGEMAKRDMLRPCQIGLQSIREQALKFARRPFRSERFEERLECFYRATGNFAAIDLIFGLPGDDFDSYMQGVDYVFSKQPFAMLLHHLVVIGGTAQERNAAQHNVLYDSSTGLVYKNDDWSRASMDAAAELSYAGRVIYNIRWWPLRILLFELSNGSFSGFLTDVVAHMRDDGGYSPSAERILDAAVAVLESRCRDVDETRRRDHLQALIGFVKPLLGVQATAKRTAAPEPTDVHSVETWRLNRSSVIIHSEYTFGRELHTPERYELGSLSRFAEKRDWYAVATRLDRDIAVIPGGYVEFLATSQQEWQLLQWAIVGRLAWKDVQSTAASAGLDHDGYREAITHLAHAGVIQPRERVGALVPNMG